MEGIAYDCILLVVLMGLRTMELWEIMTSSDVRAITQYLKKIFFSKFRVKIECSCSNGNNEPRILKFPKFRLNWGINTLLRYKFGLKIDFIRVWPWKINCIVSQFVSLTQFCGTHSFNQSWFSPDVTLVNNCTISLLRGVDTVYSLKSQLKLISTYHIWYSLSHVTSMRAKSKSGKLMIKALFLEIELSRYKFWARHSK